MLDCYTAALTAFHKAQEGLLACPSTVHPHARGDDTTKTSGGMLKYGSPPRTCITCAHLGQRCVRHANNLAHALVPAS